MPYRIELDHNHATVVDRTLLPLVKDILSFRHPQYEEIIRNDYSRGIHRYTNPDGTPRWDGMVRFLKNGQFPSGLLPIVLDAMKGRNGLTEQDILYPEYPEAQGPIGDFPDSPLRDYQFRAAEVMLERHRGILWLATNAGKTLIAIAVTRALGQPTLFLVHRRSLMHQTAKEFKRLLPDCDIGTIGDAIWKPGDITIATIQTLSGRFSKSGFRYIPSKELKEFLDKQKVLFFDECHRTATSLGVRTIGDYCGAPYRFGLSGTPIYKSDLDSITLMGATGPVLARVTNQELIVGGYSAEPLVYMLDVPQGPKVCPSQKWRRAYEMGIMENPERTDLILKILKASAGLGLPAVVIVKRIQHGEELTQSCLGSGLRAAFLSGQDPTPRRDAVMAEFGKTLDVIVASTIFEEGLNIPQMRVLVLAGGGKSERAVLQSVGRVLRRSTEEQHEIAYVFDFIDNGNSYILGHTQDRLKHYRAEGFKISSAFPNEFEEAIHEGISDRQYPQ